ncbi:hypothetical protein Cni_G22307 [Canna indica]|uniref:Phospholipase-like protein n=1 Tax=Canna indica TaxID=4628 RepID=A0AAQ3KU10_9LILI|nr:hypothetical protein Cni_G22307 [Canna indica]
MGGSWECCKCLDLYLEVPEVTGLREQTKKDHLWLVAGKNLEQDLYKCLICVWSQSEDYEIFMGFLLGGGNLRQDMELPSILELPCYYRVVPGWSQRDGLLKRTKELARVSTTRWDSESKEGDGIKLALLFISHCVIFGLDMRAAIQPWALMLVENIVKWNDFPWSTFVYQQCLFCFEKDWSSPKDRKKYKFIDGEIPLYQYPIHRFVWVIQEELEGMIRNINNFASTDNVNNNKTLATTRTPLDSANNVVNYMTPDATRTPLDSADNVVNYEIPDATRTRVNSDDNVVNYETSKNVCEDATKNVVNYDIVVSWIVENVLGDADEHVGLP